MAFAHRWQVRLHLTRTSLTLDPDINPEGFNQKVSWDLKTPFLKNFTVQGMQLLYNEVAKGDDSFALGGNVSAAFQFGPLTTTPSFTLIDWGFPNAILNASAFANQATTSGNPRVKVPVVPQVRVCPAFRLAPSPPTE